MCKCTTSTFDLTTVFPNNSINTQAELSERGFICSKDSGKDARRHLRIIVCRSSWQVQLIARQHAFLAICDRKCHTLNRWSLENCFWTRISSALAPTFQHMASYQVIVIFHPVAFFYVHPWNIWLHIVRYWRHTWFHFFKRHQCGELSDFHRRSHVRKVSCELQRFARHHAILAISKNCVRQEPQTAEASEPRTRALESESDLVARMFKNFTCSSFWIVSWSSIQLPACMFNAEQSTFGMLLILA